MNGRDGYYWVWYESVKHGMDASRSLCKTQKVIGKIRRQPKASGVWSKGIMDREEKKGKRMGKRTVKGRIVQ